MNARIITAESLSWTHKFDSKTLILDIAFVWKDEQAEALIAESRDEVEQSAHIADLLLEKERFRLLCAGFCFRYMDRFFDHHEPREPAWWLVIGCADQADENVRILDYETFYVEVSCNPKDLIRLTYKERNGILYGLVDQAFSRLEHAFNLKFERTRSIFEEVKDYLTSPRNRISDTHKENLLCGFFDSEEDSFYDVSDVEVCCDTAELYALNEATGECVKAVEAQMSNGVGEDGICTSCIKLDDKTIRFIVVE